MQPHEIHHIKSYIVFSILSIILVGILVYLYVPLQVRKSLGSSTFESQTLPEAVAIVEPPEMGVEEKSFENNTSDVTKSGRRIRLTQVLIRTQKELKVLEDQRKSSSQGLDPAAEQKITKLREKITNIEKAITDIK